MPEPKRGYQVRIKQPVRQSSITCIPTHSRSWYHQDRRTHIFFLCISVHGQRKDRREYCLWKSLSHSSILYVIYVERLVHLPHLYSHVLHTDDLSKCEIGCVTWQGSVSWLIFHPCRSCLSVSDSEQQQTQSGGPRAHRWDCAHFNTVSIQAGAQLA